MNLSFLVYIEGKVLGGDCMDPVLVELMGNLI